MRVFSFRPLRAQKLRGCGNAGRLRRIAAGAGSSTPLVIVRATPVSARS